ncbi:MAG: AAA family ATPase, partial [Thermoproteota archaeon]
MDPEKLFKGLADYGEVKQELTEAIIWPLIRSDLAREYGVEMAKGILLFGPPGCGKTLLMKTLAENTGLSFIHVKLGEILSKWYGESERNLLAIFERARAMKPCIIFLDELDSIGKRRDLYSSDDVTPRLLSLMLSEMDGMRSEGGIVVVGATNMPDLLDPALLRPGRFDKLIYVPPPDFRARVEILKAKCTNLPLAEDVNFESLAKATERFSGADLS